MSRFVFCADFEKCANCNVGAFISIFWKIYLLCYVLGHTVKSFKKKQNRSSMDVLSGRWSSSECWVVRRQSAKHSLPRMLRDEELEFDVVQSWWGGEEKKVPVNTIIQAFGDYLRQVSLSGGSSWTCILTRVHGVCCLCGWSCSHTAWTAPCWPVVSRSPSCLIFRALQS